jgi:hypothetical protein
MQLLNMHTLEVFMYEATIMHVYTCEYEHTLSIALHITEKHLLTYYRLQFFFLLKICPRVF